MADLNQAQKSEVHETTDDAASSPASSFDAGAGDADAKRNPDRGTGAAPDAGQGNSRKAPTRDPHAADPPGAIIVSDESDDGGPIRIQTTDTDNKTGP